MDKDVRVAADRGGEVAVRRRAEGVVPLVHGQVDGSALGAKQQRARKRPAVGPLRPLEDALNGKGVPDEQA